MPWIEDADLERERGTADCLPNFDHDINQPTMMYVQV